MFYETLQETSKKQSITEVKFFICLIRCMVVVKLLLIESFEIE